MNPLRSLLYLFMICLTLSVASAADLFEDFKPDPVVDYKEVLLWKGESLDVYPIEYNYESKEMDYMSRFKDFGGVDLYVEGPKKLRIYDYKGEVFRITSTDDIKQVGDVTKTRETAYTGNGSGMDVLESTRDLIRQGNHICVADEYVVEGSGLAKRTTYTSCWYYPQNIIDGKDTTIFKETPNGFTIDFTKPYDPTYRNLTVGLIGCWDLEDGTDYLGNYDLDNYGGVGFVTGKVGDAAEFNATTAMLNNSGFGDALLDQSALSYAAWVEADSAVVDRSILRGDTSNNGLQLWYDADSGGTVRHDSAHYVGQTLVVESATGEQTTNYQHIVFTWDASFNSGYPIMFLDGSATAFSTNDSVDDAGDNGTLFDNDYFAIGTGTKGGWDGEIDSVMFWNIQLNQSDVDALYNAGSGVTCSDLTGAGGGSPLNWNNTLLIAGDSIAKADAYVDENQTFHYLLADYMNGHGYENYTNNNQGIGGSCLVDYGSCTDPLETRLQTDVIDQDANITIIIPPINDLVYAVSFAQYAAALENVTYNITTYLPGTQLILTTYTGVTDVDAQPIGINQENIAVINNIARRNAIKYGIPFAELHYDMNHNTSLNQGDELHLSVSGNEFVNSSLWEVINHSSTYTYTPSFFSWYHDCDNTVEIFNYSLSAAGANCAMTTSADWVVLLNVTHGSFTADADVAFNLTNNDTYAGSDAVNITADGSSEIVNLSSDSWTYEFPAGSYEVTIASYNYSAPPAGGDDALFAYYTMNQSRYNSVSGDYWLGLAKAGSEPANHSSGALGYAYDLAGGSSGDGFVANKTHDMIGNFSFSGWWNWDSKDDFALSIRQDNSNYIRFSSLTSNDSLYLSITDGGVGVYHYTAAEVNTGEWYHLVGVFDAENDLFQLYINGTLEFNISAAGKTTEGWAADLNIGVFYAGLTAQTTNGKVDELAFYDSVLSQTKVTALWGGGTPPGYGAEEGGGAEDEGPRIIILAKEWYDNTTVSNFTSTMDNGTSRSTTNGTVYWRNLTIGTYTFNATYNDHFNVTNDFSVNAVANETDYTETVYPYQAVVSFEAYETFTGDSVPGASFTSNSTYFKAGNGYVVTASKADYFDKTAIFNVNALDNITVNVTDMYELLLGVYIRTSGNSSLLNSTDIIIEGTTEDGDPYSDSASNVTVGGYNFTLLHGYYNFSTLPEGFSFGNGSVNTTGDATNQTIKAYVLHYTQNSVDMYFYDELNFSLVTWDTVYIDLISEVYSNTYNTTTGVKFVDLLSPAEYNIRYRADGYAPRNYFFILENNTYNILNLTLLENGEGSNVTINVYDTLQNPLIGARVKILKYIVPTNSYRLVDVRETNFEGETNAYMQLNTEYYQFIVEYDTDGDGNLDTVLTTSPTYIYDTTVNLYANTQESGFNTLFELTGLYGVITYDNATREASFTFNDGDGIASQGCVYGYRLLMGERNSVNSSCTAGASGISIITLPNVNASYELRGYITKDSTDRFVTQKFVLIGGTYLFNDSDSLFLSAIIIISMFFLGFIAVELAIVMSGFATMVLSFVGILNVPLGVTVPVFALSLVIAFLIGKRRGVL